MALVAELRSDVINEDAGDYKGLFRLLIAEWMSDKWKSDEFHFSFKEDEIEDWRKQTTMFTLMTLRAVDEFVGANEKGRPNVLEDTASFRNAATLVQAMNAFVRDIERPQNMDAEVAARLGIAQSLLGV